MSVASCVGLLSRQGESGSCVWAVNRQGTNGSDEICNVTVFLGSDEHFMQFATTNESGRRASVTAVRLNGSSGKAQSSLPQLWLVIIFEM